MRNGIHRFTEMEQVVYGRPFAAAAAAEVERLGARAVYVMVGGTLSRETDVLTQLRDALGNRLAGICTKMGAHTPRADVVAAANAAREAKADLILTLGGGSITDGAKVVELCLGNGVTTTEELGAFAAKTAPDGSSHRPPTKPPTVRGVTIPTTLSAGEFSAFAGCTDTERMVKESYLHPQLIPLTVILDPAVTVHTPEWLFLSTGIRAVDHATEALCSIASAPYADASAMHALRLLGRGLKGVKANPGDLDARLDCQTGAWLSMAGVGAGVPMGASHGIGHVLGGTAGVPHGYTSCIMLPHVLRYNESVNAERQAWVSEALGEPGARAGDVVGALIAGLGLPTRLRDVGAKQEQFDRIAAQSMHDRWLPTNPRKIDGPATVKALLEQAW
jgi:maleylacetate reductase